MYFMNLKLIVYMPNYKSANDSVKHAQTCLSNFIRGND